MKSKFEEIIRCCLSVRLMFYVFCVYNWCWYIYKGCILFVNPLGCLLVLEIDFSKVKITSLASHLSTVFHLTLLYFLKSQSGPWYLYFIISILFYFTKIMLFVNFDINFQFRAVFSLFVQKCGSALTFHFDFAYVAFM